MRYFPENKQFLIRALNIHRSKDKAERNMGDEKGEDEKQDRYGLPVSGNAVKNGFILPEFLFTNIRQSTC